MARGWGCSGSALLALVLFSGCGGAPATTDPGDGRGSESRFPSQRDLDALADEPPPEAPDAFSARDVETWELVGPFPERVAVAAAVEDTPWDLVLVEEAQRRVGLIVPTAPMRCVAREVGNFFLSTGGDPSPGLQRYIASRCNAAVVDTRFSTLRGLASESTTEEVIFAEWREAFVENVRKVATGGAVTAGVWFGRRGDQAVAIAAAGQRRVFVDPVPEVPGPDGHVRLVGEMILPASQVWAVANRGRYAYSQCEPDPEVALPRFAFDCEVDPTDESAIVSLGYSPPGRMLGDVGLNILVWPAGRTTATYRRPSYGEPHTVLTEVAARSRFLELLNEVRRKAGLDAVREAALQSEIATELAPHYFAAVTSESSVEVADVVALGMIAGWSVDGIVQSGRFTTSWVSQTNDVERLLSEALQHPMGRSVLLDPDMDEIAIGALVDARPQSPTLAAVIGTYTLFSEEVHAQNVKRVYEIFEAARKRQGNRPADHLDELQGLSTEAAGMVQGGLAPEEALDFLLEASVEVLQRPVNGWIAEVSDLADLVFPDDFLSPASLGIAVGVSYHRPANEPWGRYIVMVVAAGPQSHQI